MTIKDLLLQEIESTSDIILAETLDFLHFLKTKENQTQPVSEVTPSATHTPVKSTCGSLLEHLKIIGKWSGDDLEECLQAVYDNRSEAEF
ncbi:DUF2281 domain-containing protein [Komarekiella sp. 'clone 1']|uniref:DUF2281 domain-containing protein n=1 Tax=Komarekiella delphini-convector SJRDD-AB1 TaxID=2593771 RepID=A0AA40T4G2_9NOST|nr:DUF2281 domain-containing protein [Komarekiella delphini-convector]MBD6620756.1 DUF2281 domain-containing protein [Komarekiella delphini-convector SJRDD-AB1]